MAYETKLHGGDGIEVSGPCVIQLHDCGKVTLRVAPSTPGGVVLISPLDAGDERLKKTERALAIPDGATV